MARAFPFIEDVPLFPLATVLFPHGPLELRVFEPRYLDLVRVRADGQLRGDLSCWPSEAGCEVAPEFGLLVTILERLVEEIAPAWRTVPRRYYDDASWVGFRLAELLPLANSERQQLLEVTDPVERLARLRDVLPRFQRD